MATEAEVLFLGVFLPEAHRRMEAAGKATLESWQARAQQLETDDKPGAWAAIEAYGEMADAARKGRWWDDDRGQWLAEPTWRALHGMPPWEVEMAQLEFELSKPVDETPLVDMYVAALREGRWNGLGLATGYPVTADLQAPELERILDAERRVQAGEWPEWASDEEVMESFDVAPPEWKEEFGEHPSTDCLGAGRATARLWSTFRVVKLLTASERQAQLQAVMDQQTRFSHGGWSGRLTKG